MRIWQREPNGPWWVDFTVPGRERFRRSTGTTDRRQAEAWAAEAHAAQWRQSRLGERPVYSWGHAVADWLTKYADERRSIETIKDRLRWLTTTIGRDTPLHAISRECVEKMMAAKKKAGIPSRIKDPAKRPPPRPVSPKTLNNYVTEISKILNHAHAMTWLDAAPILRTFDTETDPINWLSRKEADRLLAELPPHLARMAEFALASGVRESNVRLLRWKQVDMARAIAWVEASEAKAKKPIAVPLNADAIAVLKGQDGKHPIWVFPYTAPSKKGRPAKNGRQATEDAPPKKPGPVTGCSTAAWYKATKRAGVAGFRFHDLRHTWASWHVQAGTPLPVLQQLGGWSSLAMVQRYAHLGRDHTAAWADAVSRHTSGTLVGSKRDDEAQVPDSMGWLMGLEPTTTGITTRDSTN